MLSIYYSIHCTVFCVCAAQLDMWYKHANSCFTKEGMLFVLSVLIFANSSEVIVVFQFFAPISMIRSKMPLMGGCFIEKPLPALRTK